LASAVLDIRAAIGAVHIGERPISPPRIERQNALLRLILAGMPRRDVRQIDRKNVGDQDFRGTTTAGATWLIFVGEVLAEGPLGAGAIRCSAARADLARFVSDDPHRALSKGSIGVAPLRAKPEAGSLAWTRHSFLISSMAASVV
jgi:hypothetical protein